MFGLTVREAVREIYRSSFPSWLMPLFMFCLMAGIILCPVFILKNCDLDREGYDYACHNESVMISVKQIRDEVNVCGPERTMILSPESRQFAFANYDSNTPSSTAQFPVQCLCLKTSR